MKAKYCSYLKMILLWTSFSLRSSHSRSCSLCFDESLTTRYRLFGFGESALDGSILQSRVYSLKDAALLSRAPFEEHSDVNGLEIVHFSSGWTFRTNVSVDSPHIYNRPIYFNVWVLAHLILYWEVQSWIYKMLWAYLYFYL